MVVGTATLLIGLKHFQATRDLMCAVLLTHMGYTSCMRSKQLATVLDYGSSALLHYSITGGTTAMPWCSVDARLEHLVLSVCQVPNYCLLSPLMSPKDSKLIDDYTCASKPGCLMSHNWLHTPDCKV